MDDSLVKIGLVGLDSSHVLAFLDHFNGPPHAAGTVPGGRITAAFQGGSPEVDSSRLRVARFTQAAVDGHGIRLYASIAELTAAVDAVMILSVDGRQHLDQFRHTTRFRKPVFIDKPLGGSLRDACEIARLSQDTGTPCFSASSFRYLPDSPWKQLQPIGQITAAFSYGPADREPHHPDLFWYGIHAVESLYAALGAGCKQVARTVGEHADVVTGLWSDGRVGVMMGNRNAYRGHGVTVIGMQGIAIGGMQHSYQPLAHEILSFFRGRAAPVSLDTTVEIHAFMEAADESKRRSGAPVTLREVMEAAN